ncbi:MAG: MBL fold metallo-hydrolase [Candidatus Liptonbacteria bacterium]|nr:MBL fold metallo-hydrolase [Candidatus Liptonbacteria bacterium]
MRLTFHGGAGSVTGANYLLEIEGEKKPIKFLIDCGLHQGGHFAEKENFEAFSYDPKEIDALFVTHAHIDHVGLIPKMFREGFRGTVYSTPPTRDCAELLLLDSEHLLQKEAERERTAPLYTVIDIETAMRHWHGVPYHETIEYGGMKISFLDAGHVLGSSIVKFEIREKNISRSIVFSGDLGNDSAPIIKPTEQVEAADYCIIESTYGDRVHEEAMKQEEALEDVIEATVKAGGTLLIPAFALERTQKLLYHLNNLFEKGKVPRAPVFIDSPLAIKLTGVYKKYEHYFNKETRAQVKSGDDILNFPNLRLCLTSEQSKEINEVMPPKIIIAGSGMSQGGRILHHEKRYLPDPKSTILFAGYQTKGSLGRAILDGAKKVTIHGEEVEVHARRVAVSGYSAHADQPKLLHWLRSMRYSLRKVFVVQGENGASLTLAGKIKDMFAVEAVVPKKGESFELV